MRQDRARHTPGQYWLAFRSALWLCLLPLLLRKHSLPGLLEMIAGRGKRSNNRERQELNQTVSTLARLCQVWFFRLPIFPRDCLRQSLVLYRELTALGYAVEIHFGVRKNGPMLEGHSWVTLNGTPLAEHGPVTRFTKMYSYPNSEAGQTLDERLIFRATGGNA